MDIGGGPKSHTKHVNVGLLHQFWNSNPSHIFRGRLLHQWLENLSYISFFVSSNWVVINHQKGRDCKERRMTYGKEDTSITLVMIFDSNEV
jgi:hypothetical protein